MTLTDDTSDILGRLADDVIRVAKKAAEARLGAYRVGEDMVYPPSVAKLEHLNRLFAEIRRFERSEAEGLACLNAALILLGARRNDIVPVGDYRVRVNRGGDMAAILGRITTPEPDSDPAISERDELLERLFEYQGMVAVQ